MVEGRPSICVDGDSGYYHDPRPVTPRSLCARTSSTHRKLPGASKAHDIGSSSAQRRLAAAITCRLHVLPGETQVHVRSSREGRRWLVQSMARPPRLPRRPLARPTVASSCTRKVRPRGSSAASGPVCGDSQHRRRRSLLVARRAGLHYPAGHAPVPMAAPPSPPHRPGHDLHRGRYDHAHRPRRDLGFGGDPLTATRPATLSRSSMASRTGAGDGRHSSWIVSRIRRPSEFSST